MFKKWTSLIGFKNRNFHIKIQQSAFSAQPPRAGHVQCSQVPVMGPPLLSTAGISFVYQPPWLAFNGYEFAHMKLSYLILYVFISTCLQNIMTTFHVESWYTYITHIIIFSSNFPPFPPSLDQSFPFPCFISFIFSLIYLYVVLLK